MPDKPPLIACGFLIYRAGNPIELLIMEHSNRLDLPKGHLDAGESLMECACRELQEETGIEFEQIEVIQGFEFVTRYTVSNNNTGFKPCEKELRIYLARLIDQEVTIHLTEHEGYRWVPWRRGLKIQAETLNPLLRHLDDFWSKPSETI